MASVTMSTLFLAFILIFASIEASSQGEAMTQTQSPGIMGSHSAANSISPFMAQQAGIKTHFASWNTAKGEWLGARVKINVWGIPNVQPHAHSSAYVTVFNYDGASKDAISAGVHVYPALYGDHDLHFFVDWTRDDGNSSGCYNTRCPGFINANWSNLTPGHKLRPLSTYGGKGYYITLRVKKDVQTGNWSLYREDKGGEIDGAFLVGTWPKSLFTGLGNFATKIQFGGGVSWHVDETSPSMGSGHCPDEGEGKAAYFKNIIAYDIGGNEYELNGGDVTTYEDANECYRVSDWLESKDDGHYFYYGGPSGCKS